MKLKLKLIFITKQNKLVKSLSSFFLIIIVFFIINIEKSAISTQLQEKKARETTVEISTDASSESYDFEPSGTGIIIEKNIYNPKKHVNHPSSIIPKYEYSVLTNRHVILHIAEKHYIRINNELYGVVAVYPTNQNIENSPDLALIKFLSDRDLEVLIFGDLNLTDVNKTIYIGGWADSKFNFRRGNIKEISLSNITYTDQTEETIVGMSGGPILDDNSELIGIHSGVKAGIPVSIIRLFLQAQKDQYGTEEKDSASCHNTLKVKCKKSIVVMP